jgi:hypothetical protein
LSLLSDICRSPWPKSGLRGSLRSRANAEVREQLRTNDALQRNRYSLGVRLLARWLGGHSIGWFLLRYGIIAIAIVALEIAVARYAPTFLPDWAAPRDSLWGFIKDADSYFLATQVTLIGLIFPIAVGMVTLIIQRQQASNTTAHIQIYYSESLAYGVGASGIGLTIILVVQTIWPLQFVIHRLGLGTSNLIFKIALVGIHCIWLVLNGAAIWHFLAASLDFVQPERRAALRKRYSTRIAIPLSLYDDLMRTFYHNAAGELLPQVSKEEGPLIFLGYGKILDGQPEVQRDVWPSSRLSDVWMRPLSVALSLWWRRTVKRDLHKMRGPQRVSVAFERSILADAHGTVTLARRRGGAPFTAFERWLIRGSFRYERIHPQ